MQIILGILLTIIGISYCLEVIMPIHERFLQRIKKRYWKAYLSFQSKVFFGAALMLILADIAKQVNALTPSQNISVTAGVMLVGLGLIIYSNKKYKGRFPFTETKDCALNKMNRHEKRIKLKVTSTFLK